MSARAAGNTENLAQKAQSEFAALDVDNDGTVDIDEVRRNKGVAEKLSTMFKKYDRNGDGTMSKAELSGVFKALDRNLSDVELEVAFKQADRNTDGTVDLEEFILWIVGRSRGDGALAKNAVQAEFARLPEVGDDEMDWKYCLQYFGAFAGKDGGISGQEWAKFCRQSGIYDKKFKSADADMIFSRVCDKGVKKISAEQFKMAVRFVAQKKGCTVRQVQATIHESRGPEFEGTKAVANRLHDDKSTYTGVKAGEDGAAGREEARAQRLAADGDASAAAADEMDWRPCAVMFEAFGGAEMDGREFAKLCRDSDLLGKAGFKAEDVDSTFIAVCEHGKRRIGLEQFKQALRKIAKKKGCPVSQVQAAVMSSHGPVTNATKAEYNKFHDDKTLYTGVHVNGGPSTIDRGHDLSELVASKTGATGALT